ncbi:hypothetical protein JRQ81_001397 [Phrynocephalus forsythii]|uniref:ShKT domain-containing protein n=1 Tax=Phrynocephalus forsythii TaxID=171643 RepID=A0A9Q0Y892_9SAUR|nr:hypothetical protein JRQ81_001397 [Phrynocephalus forsythii]
MDKAMFVLLTLLALAAGLHQCVGNEDSEEVLAALSTDLLTVQNEIVDKHNDLRRAVDPSGSNMLKMKWNETAASNAKNWAKECSFEHSPESLRTIEGGMACGENLYYSTIPQLWPEALQAWYDEVNDFTFGVGPLYEDAVIGHYTQLVWYSSYLLGCAMAYCPNDKYSYYYVCHYCPAGNVMGQSSRPYTAGEPCGKCPDSCDNGLCTNPCEHDDLYSNCPDLKKKHSCKHPALKSMCPASCGCENKIH